MSRNELPEGVPADNETRMSYASKEPPRHDVPDMATPDFAKQRFSKQEFSKQEFTNSAGPRDLGERPRMSHHVHHGGVDADDDDAIRLLPRSVNPAALMGFVAMIVVLFAIFMMVNNRPSTPLCSTQPDWNQYNCRPG